MQPTVYLAFNDSNGKLVSAVAFEEPYDNHSGEVLETVDFLENGTPDWRGGGICDERGAGPLAFTALHQALVCAEQNAEIIGYEMRRVPRDLQPRVVKLIWKDEGDAGPITLLTQEDIDNPVFGRPYDPNRPAPKWFTREEAQRMAHEMEVEFEES